MITRRQIDALDAAFNTGNAFSMKRGAISNMGGAIRRMIDMLEVNGYLNKDRDITAKGMRALLVWYRARQRKAPNLAERIREIEARLPKMEEAEEEAARIAEAEEADRRRIADERKATAKARQITGFRQFFADLAFKGDANEAAIAAAFEAMDDDAMLALIERIVLRSDAI
jgi:hypothetical protein